MQFHSLNVHVTKSLMAQSEQGNDDAMLAPKLMGKCVDATMRVPVADTSSNEQHVWLPELLLHRFAS